MNNPIKNLSIKEWLLCFASFFFNDMYGFICWRKRELKQI